LWASTNAYLETLVKERTANLGQTNRHLEVELAERVRAEDALRESEQKYRLMVENAGEAICVAQRGMLKFVNRRASELFGYSEDILTTKPFIELVHPEDREMVLDRHLKRLGGEEVPHVYPFRGVAKDGTVKWLEIHAAFVLWEEEPATVNFLNDITERKQIEEAQAFLLQCGLPATGEDFFASLARYLAKTLGKEYVCIDRLEGDGLTAQTVAVYNDGKFESNVKYALKDTPCGEVVDKSVCCYPRGVQQLFPRDTALQELKAESYFGTTLWDSRGTPIGLIAVIGHRVLNDAKWAESLLKLVAPRAAGELERRQTEESLLESEGRFRALFEDSRDALMILEPPCWGFSTANAATLELFGAKNKEAFISCNPWELSPERQPDGHLSAEKAMEMIQTAMREGSHFYEWTHKRMNGEEFPATTRLSKMEYGGKSVLQATVRNIAERKRAEEALREVNEYLNNLINYANAPIIVWDPEFRVTRFNHAFEKLTGRTSQEVIGETLEILFPPGRVDASMSTIKQTQPGEFWETVEIGILHVDGTVRPVLWNSATIFATDGITPLATIAQGHDITDRKQAEEEKAKLQAQTWQLQKAESLGRMAGAIAHHFNNQLQAVIGYLEMAMGDLPQETRPHANIIEALKASCAASEISGLMLTYLGQTLGSREPLDLSETCRQGLPMLQSAMPKGTVLETDLPCPGPAVSANANQIQQVLTNLITNAWEALGDGQGAIHLTVKTVSSAEISTAHRFPIDWQPQDNLYACLEVADTGCGIVDGDIENFFDPFFSSKFTGRGLGLAVVLGIIRAHRGAVAVESEPGRGSVFRVFFPVWAEDVARELDEPAQAPEMERGGTVLLVEDEEMVRDMAEAVLTSLGFKVLAAKDGLEAVEMLRQHQDEIHCVLLDLTMPHMDGWETLAALRGLRSDIPVVLVSGYDEANVMQGDHAELPQAFLHKPYSMKDLKAALCAAQKTPFTQNIGS
jgi:PAS domain S-box-containing protein